MNAKAGALLGVVILSNVLGNLLLSLGMRGHAAPAAPLIAAGVLLLIVWTLSRMALMSWADLSFVLPVTSVGYVLSVLAGRYFLGEQISVYRAMGAALIVAGAALAGRTPPQTAKEPSA